MTTIKIVTAQAAAALNSACATQQPAPATPPAVAATVRPALTDVVGDLGATHLVWEAQVLAQGATTSRGKAYRC